MKRKNFLKTLGITGVGLTLPVNRIAASPLKAKGSCILIPTETAGPFPLDLTENTTFYRKNIAENKTGVPLTVRMKILGNDNCEPMANLRVNIWHCDKDGLYSGYSETNNPGQAGLTYLRGYQFTDVNGEVEFTTIFPGWYSGRICHIHFQVYVSSSYAAISQLTFDPNTKNAIYSANSSLYTKGADPMTLASDNIFSDGYQYQMASLTPVSGTGGYETYLEVTIQGKGTTGLGNAEKLNARHFSLDQNFPNPFKNTTTIPFQLITPSDVTLKFWNENGQLVKTFDLPGLSPGRHEIIFSPEQLNLSVQNFVYGIEVQNSAGKFCDSKLMTASKE